MNKRFKIKGPIDNTNGENEQLYWSNVIGWVGEGSATIFYRKDLPMYMPIGAVALAWLKNGCKKKIQNVEPLTLTR